MPELNWLQILPSVLFGGVAGQLIRMGWEHWKERQQPVHYRCEIDRIFSSTSGSALQAKVTLLHDHHEFDFGNPTLAKVAVKNRSNVNHPEFDFGVTLDYGHKIVLVESETPDRHHEFGIKGEPPSPETAASILDVRCKPLNRKDAYTIKLYVTSESEVLAADDIKVSTAAPVRLVQIGSTEDFDNRARSRWSTIAVWLTMIAVACGGTALWTVLIRDVMQTRADVEKLVKHPDEQHDSGAK
jgi:hypothetical protein